MTKEPVIAIILPCFNEELALPKTISVLLKILDKMVADKLVAATSYILCCDDGSIDETWTLINKFHICDNRVKGISLSHNQGHQYALFAGLMEAKDNCDAAISIDADLQDNPDAIQQMVNEFVNGKEIVYGVRSNRTADSWFKRTTAQVFYKTQNLLGLETIYNHADFRLMSNRALRILSEYGENNLFLRGIVPQIGLESGVVTYERNERVAGVSKYSLRKMVSFSIDGITSFSAKPMRMIFVVGLMLLLIDVVVAIYVFISYFSNNTISGWTSLMLSVWFLGSLILIGLGVVGEYIGKIFIEVKRRPRYAIKEKLLD